MKLSSAIWKKAVALDVEYAKKEEVLSRDKLVKLLGVCERDARYIFDLLRDRSVILYQTGYKDHASLISQNRKLRHNIKEARGEINRLVRSVEIASELKYQSLCIPKFAAPGVEKGHAIACAMLSDTHFDEVVRPEEIGFVNAYNRDIATSRLQRYFRSLVKLKGVHLSGINIDGLVLMLAGDMVSGTIHDELVATNEFSITDTIVYYTEQLIAGINLLLEHYKKIFVPCVVGNHGRLTPKVKYKGAVTDNYDYLFYQLVASHFKNTAGISFYIPVGPDAIFPVRNTTICLSHGNQFRGGNGWAGPLMPIMKGDKNKRERQAAIKEPYDVLCTGHFHTLKFLGRQVMSGSLVGFNEFCNGNNFGFEPPQQAYFLVDDKRGITVTSPVHCKDDFESWETRKTEKMMFAV